VLNVNTQQLDNVSNIFRRLQCVTHQMLKSWSTTLTGAWDFGSVMEVQHACAVRGFEEAVRCDHTAEELRME
jgi:hypothetical protein